jgi:vancomycin resistance protein VanW
MRVWLAATRRALKDVRTGARWRMVRRSERPATGVEGWPERLSVSQPLGHSSHVEGKRHNLAVAIRLLRDVRIGPGELFSFWALVGNPSHGRGFVSGRTLLEGHLLTSEGGGLCQLSGLIYLLALRGGLRIIERSAHSVDLYTEQTRYAPLGADATVAYGYKDLRFLNTLPFPVALRFNLGQDTLTGSVHAPEPLVACTVEFTREDGDPPRVTTWRHWPGARAPECLGTSRYARPRG